MAEQEETEWVDRLQREFERLIEHKEYKAALPVIQELTALILRLAGEGSDSHDTCRENLAGPLFYLKRYRESAELHEQVIQSRDWKGANTDESAEVNLSHLVDCYYQLGDFVSAEPATRRLLAIRQKRGSVLKEMGNLAVCLREQGKNDEAAELYLSIISESKTIASERPGSYAHALNNYALLLKRIGKYKKAVSLYRKAVRVLVKAKAKRRLYLQVLANLANAYDELGDEGATRRVYDKLFSILDNRPHFAPEVRALALNNQAQEDLNRGDHQGAKKKLQESADLVKQQHGDKHPRYATAVSNLGVFHMGIGDLVKAEQEFQRALEIRLPVLGDSSPEVAQSLNNLGAVARRRGDLPRAIRLLEESLAAKRRAFKGPHPSLATSMNNVGSLLMIAEKWDEAKGILLETLQVLEQSVGSRSSDYAQTLQNLGDMYKRQGHYQKAEGYLDRAREQLLGKYGSSENLALATINLAELYAVTNRPGKALSMMNEVAALDQGTVSRVFTVASERQRMVFLKEIQTRDHVHWSLILWKFRDSAKAVHDAFSCVLKRKAIGAEAITGQRDGILSGRHPNLQTRLEELTALRREVARAALAGPTSGDHAAHSKHLGQLESRRESIEADLSGSIPEIELLKRLEDATPEAVAQKLPPDSVLVEFLRLRVRAFEAVVARRERTWKPDRYIAFVLASGKPDDVRLLDLGDADEIDDLVIAYRALASIPPSSRAASLEHASKRLRNAIFDPLVPLLNGLQKLVLCPDSELNMLPFEALALDDGRLMMEDYLISYLTCGRDALRFGLPPFGNVGASVVVADPSYNLTASKSAESERATRSSKDLDRGLRFGRLRYTQEEAEKIAALLGVTPWLGDNALESRVKQARSPRVLHLATHGFVLPDQAAIPPTEPAISVEERRLTGVGMENPLLRSGLAFAGANIWLRGGKVPAEAEDGILTAEDVTGMDLLDTELVVLSACETGLGKVHVGEGVFGLRRAFVLAGARRLVMSLWKVPDRHTQELMVEFYNRLVAGDGGAEALRGAKLAMKATYPDTYYWTAFIFLGDPSPFRVTGRV